ncbi:MAG: YbbR-like domain-containing protein [Bacteroidota bacterium]
MRSLNANLRTLLWAFILALAVWVAAVTAADPDQVRSLASPVPVEVVGQASGLVLRSDFPRQVSVILRAPTSVWERISAQPSSVRAILDLSGLGAGDHKLNIQVQISERPVRIVSVTPAQVSVSLEHLASRTLPVDLTLAGQPAVGYLAGKAILKPEEVAVAGAESKVEQVARARVAVSLDGAREGIDQSLPVEVLDADGRPVTGLSVSPEEIRVTLPIAQQGGYRDLAVKVVVKGQVATGYRLSNISVFPPVVTVYSSDPAVVNSLPGVVETQPLELRNASDDVTTRLGLNLPEGVSVVGERTVLIQAGISPIQSSLTISNEEVQIVGLTAGMTAEILPVTVDVIVSGPLPLLDTLTRQDIRVTVDVTGLPVGVHQLEPKIEILISDVSVDSILPGTIEVTITSSGTPIVTMTPTPTAGP